MKKTLVASPTDLALMMADTHLMPETVEINRSIWQQAIDICHKRGIKRIFHLGDVFDSRKAQTQEMLMVLCQLLEMVYEADLTIDIIPGNHDKTDYQSEASFLYPFRHHPGVNIVWDYMGVGSKTYPEWPEDILVTMLPFFDEKSGKYAEKLKLHTDISKRDGKHILLTHVGINGALMNGGAAIEDHLEQSAFDRFDKIYIGHYHNFQELKGGKVVYTGSCFQENFGEDNQKGFNILLSNGGIEFIKAKFPEYKKISVDLSKTSKEEILELKKEHADSEDNVRFVFEGEKEQLATIDKNEFIALGIDVKTEEADAKVVDYENMQVESFTEESIKTEWKEFTDGDEINQETGLAYLEK